MWTLVLYKVVSKGRTDIIFLFGDVSHTHGAYEAR